MTPNEFEEYLGIKDTVKELGLELSVCDNEFVLAGYEFTEYFKNTNDLIYWMEGYRAHYEITKSRKKK